METITSVEALQRATSRGTRTRPVALPRLRAINVRKFIGDAEAKAIASALKRGSFPRLESIELYNNYIHDDGAKALATALVRGTFPRLEVIDLYHNCIGDEGAKALALALERGSFQALEWMDFGGNCIGSDGVGALASLLRHGHLPQLGRMDLHDNWIDPDNANVLLTTLQQATLPSFGGMSICVDADGDVQRRLNNAITCARQRGRMLLFLGAENVRCESQAKRFLAKDGDRAIACRTLRFMLP